MTDLEDILSKCIDDVAQGRMSASEALERYPEYRSQIEPLLRTAMRLPSLPAAQPSQEFRLRARNALAIEIARSQSRPRVLRFFDALFPMRGGALRYLATPVAAVVILLIVIAAGGSGVAALSQGSLPGDLLYPVKTATEEGRMLATFGSRSKANYQARIAERRVEEVVSLAKKRRAPSPQVIDNVASELDKALREVQGIAFGDAKTILDEFARNLAVQQASIEDLRGTAPVDLAEPLARASLLVEGGDTLSGLLSESPEYLQKEVSVTAAIYADVTGAIVGLSPLRIGDVEILLSDRIRGQESLVEGNLVHAGGVFTRDGALLASQFVNLNTDSSTLVKVEGEVSNLNPLMVSGSHIILLESSKVEGEFQKGAVVVVEGHRQSDGSILAVEVKVKGQGDDDDEENHKDDEPGEPQSSVIPQTDENSGPVVTVKPKPEKPGPRTGGDSPRVSGVAAASKRQRDSGKDAKSGVSNEGSDGDKQADDSRVKRDEADDSRGVSSENQDETPSGNQGHDGGEQIAQDTQDDHDDADEPEDSHSKGGDIVDGAQRDVNDQGSELDDDKPGADSQKAESSDTGRDDSSGKSSSVGSGQSMSDNADSNEAASWGDSENKGSSTRGDTGGIDNSGSGSDDEAGEIDNSGSDSGDEAEKPDKKGADEDDKEDASDSHKVTLETDS